MNIDLAELAQHEAAWLAFGNRRASRLRWRKATNADIAANLDVALLTKKIEAHDKRLWIARAAARLFTGIERQRELLVYRLGNDVLAAIRALPTEQTLAVQNPSISKIATLTVRASRFSWFKKPFSAFMGWVNQKIGHAIVIAESEVRAAELPVELDTEEALVRFHIKKREDLDCLIDLCSRSLREVNEIPTMAEQDEKFDGCFAPYRKKVKELFLYYHPDKVSEEKAKAAGLTLETFRIEADKAFRELQPKMHDLEDLRSQMKVCRESRQAVAKNHAELQEDDVRDAVRRARLSEQRVESVGRERLFREELEKSKENAKKSARRFDVAISGLDGLFEAATPRTVSQVNSQPKVNAVDSDATSPPICGTTPSVNPNGFFAVNQPFVSGRQSYQATHRRAASH